MGKPFEKAFKAWVAEGGHGIVGNHNTGAKTRGEWDWFRDSVTSMWYMDHKDGSQPGTIHRTADAAIAGLPVLAGLDASFTGSDEWYSFDMKPWHPVESPTWKDCKVLYTLDEKSVAHLTDAMGAYHPVAWIREDALGNRFFYTTLIHSDAGAASDFYHSLILRGLEYAAGYRDPVAVGGTPVPAGPGAITAARGNDLRITVDGPWSASLRAPDGRTLWSRTGNGPVRIAPAPLARPGAYLLCLASREGLRSRRILAY
jgi:type 1 glutamine amidotransferase